MSSEIVTIIPGKNSYKQAAVKYIDPHRCQIRFSGFSCIGFDTLQLIFLRLFKEIYDTVGVIHFQDSEITCLLTRNRFNRDGYIGESTSREIAYAEKLGKPVRYTDERAAILAGRRREKGDSE